MILNHSKTIGSVISLLCSIFFYRCAIMVPTLVANSKFLSCTCLLTIFVNNSIMTGEPTHNRI